MSSSDKSTHVNVLACVELSTGQYNLQHTAAVLVPPRPSTHHVAQRAAMRGDKGSQERVTRAAPHEGQGHRRFAAHATAAAAGVGGASLCLLGGAGQRGGGGSSSAHVTASISVLLQYVGSYLST